MREMLAVIEGRFDDVYHQLDIQLRRLAQLQQEVDQLKISMPRGEPR